MRIFSFAALLLLSSLVAADAIDEAVTSEMKESQIPGTAISIVYPDGKIDRRSYGESNLELRHKVSENTVFRWASITKQFTSMAVHILAKEGRLSLDSPIRSLVKGLPESWEPIKVIHLLTHTAGIPDPQDRFRIDREYTRNQYFTVIDSGPLKWKPGEAYEYSNTGYAVLGILISDVSGMSYPEFVSKRLLEPAGMKTARFYRKSEIVPHRSGGYSSRMGSIINDEDDRPLLYAGSGGLMGSIADLEAWDSYLRKGGPGADILAQMRTRATLRDGLPSTYGRGWTIAQWGESQINSHSGSTYGFTAMMVRDLTTGISVFVLRNSNASSAVALGRTLHGLAIEAQKGSPAPPTAPALMVRN
jgi:CubicO group peptidase (beta-lactamase class C family)